MIGVTQFFGDRDGFHRIEVDELPRLLAGIEDEQEFRIWVAGCATGEEAYSLAMDHPQLASVRRLRGESVAASSRREPARGSTESISLRW